MINMNENNSNPEEETYEEDMSCDVEPTQRGADGFRCTLSLRDTSIKEDEILIA